MNDADRALCSETLRALSNPEGVNQYSHGAAVEKVAQVHDKAAAAHREAAVAHSSSSKDAFVKTDKAAGASNRADRALTTLPGFNKSENAVAKEHEQAASHSGQAKESAHLAQLGTLVTQVVADTHQQAAAAHEKAAASLRKTLR